MWSSVLSISGQQSFFNSFVMQSPSFIGLEMVRGGRECWLCFLMVGDG